MLPEKEKRDLISNKKIRSEGEGFLVHNIAGGQFILDDSKREIYCVEHVLYKKGKRKVGKQKASVEARIGGGRVVDAKDKGSVFQNSNGEKEKQESEEWVKE
ncbi:hypothetical protein LWI28_020229 [Acer negundo]|uniref:Uncharacterized protein n=1 Tax=Acer negundo TaxID=4023 RepID=A0AAD5J0J0_ACENE|nr:hypothetical protein LWI28_020229 [Acer negundo]